MLDEPTTGLDPVARQEFHAALRALSGSGTAVLVSTQDLHEAEQLATRILVLRKGQVVADGTPERLKSTVGERVLIVHGHSPDLLAAALDGSSPGDVDPITIRHADGGLQVGVGPDNNALATALSNLAPHAHLIEAMRLTPPSLDDVFLALAVG